MALEQHYVEYFQSPCLGTLFARRNVSMDSTMKNTAFNPHVWGLFLQAKVWLKEIEEEVELSIPMFGDSFCKGTGVTGNNFEFLKLSIPMFGDSFCKYKLLNMPVS